MLGCSQPQVCLSPTSSGPKEWKMRQLELRLCFQNDPLGREVFLMMSINALWRLSVDGPVTVPIFDIERSMVD